MDFFLDGHFIVRAWDQNYFIEPQDTYLKPSPFTAASYFCVLNNIQCVTAYLDRMMLLFQLMRTGMHYCLRLLKGRQDTKVLNNAHFYLTSVDIDGVHTSDQNMYVFVSVVSNVTENLTLLCVCMSPVRTVFLTSDHEAYLSTLLPDIT